MKKSSFLKHFCVHTTFSGRKIMGVPRFDGRVSVSEGKTLSTVQTNEAFRPFCLLRLPSLLWFAFGGYPTRPELCHRHSSFSGSPHTVGNHPLRRRWPEGPDEVALNGKLPGPAPSSVACGDSFPPPGEAFGSPRRTICNA